MSPAERAALALQQAWDAHDALPPITFTDGEGRYLARAVLQAIREPSAGMAAKGDFACYALYTSGERENKFEGDSVVIWEDMIDAALSE